MLKFFKYLLILAAEQLVLDFWRIDSCLLLLLQKVNITKPHEFFVDESPKLHTDSVNGPTR